MQPGIGPVMAEEDRLFTFSSVFHRFIWRSTYLRVHLPLEYGPHSIGFPFFNLESPTPINHHIYHGITFCRIMAHKDG